MKYFPNLHRISKTRVYRDIAPFLMAEKNAKGVSSWSRSTAGTSLKVRVDR